ncbi:hypothetical protein CTEN210_06253 [Chaetoceros tenuissimus]|uniref:Uncharacterized protein n=1 Tax=Chaetoceros tenuissimus TaxID=426638 RepID=A0AAD3CPP7_9STRA|nr:hypothetical protein CTEN210_06253 [Chaetoceros tenuissimus]
MSTLSKLVYLSLLISSCVAFSPVSIHTSSSRTRSITSFRQAKVGNDEEDSFPKGDNYEGDIDWDAEWAKVVKEKGANSDRPGKDFYKNDAQRAALKATKAASEQIQKVKIVKPDVNLRMLTGDAKFWIAILAIISVGLALITAPDTSSYSSSNDSFYI